MSIKSDRWIRRMARDHGMIEPFAAEQVRGLDGHRIVSYGTSSYGYDVRCAPEFKIFTNINSTIVDPKAFDEKSFVDFAGAVCIIPPNSFALARTIEYFRIPRSVLTVCLGKCVTGDTRVVDADSGGYVPITAMRWGKSTLALERSRLTRAKVAAFMPQGKREVFELRTQAGLRIRATANHPFLTSRGWVPLQELVAGDRIAVARDIPIFGNTPVPDWEAALLGLMISQGAYTACGKAPAYTTGDAILAELLRSAVRLSGLGSVSWNGGSCYRIVHRQEDNGRTEENSLHRWLHSHGLDVLAADKCIPQAIFTAPAASVRCFLQALLSADGGVHQHERAGLEYGCSSRRLIEDVHHLLLRFAVFSVIREHAADMNVHSWTLHITEPDQIGRFASLIGFVPGSTQQQGLAEMLPTLRATADRCTHVAAAGWLLQSAAPHSGASASQMAGPLPAQSVPGSAAAPLVSDRDAKLRPLVDGPMWDVIAEILPSGREEVFDISVPSLHNFVANGVIVHNSTYARCGIICNVTPLEPEWEGHVTLEFSNTTPLPAKIYANEGVAQMLFFEADEVCETSYKDRGGKYMGQQGVTLPKA